jgi:hypothetical protein
MRGLPAHIIYLYKERDREMTCQSVRVWVCGVRVCGCGTAGAGDGQPMVTEDRRPSDRRCWSEHRVSKEPAIEPVGPVSDNLKMGEESFETVCMNTRCV